jgi:hypothetical protein
MRFGACSALAFAALLTQGVASSAIASDVLGKSPTYSTRAPGTKGSDRLPNEAAIVRRTWAPGLDEGFVPQGLTVVDGAIYLGAYQSAERSKGRGPCRVFRMDPQTGDVTATLDLPSSCGHAGGLAKGAPGRIWIADTHVMFEVSLSPDEKGLGRIEREVKLQPPIKGSFAAGDGKAIWLGSYERDKPGRLYRIPLDVIADDVVGPQHADASIELPTRVQGAAIDGKGNLWITRSGAALGELLRLDGATGAVHERYAMPDGIEDLSFDASGLIWTVSEAGSRRWSNWATHFPVVFRVNPAKLR